MFDKGNKDNKNSFSDVIPSTVKYQRVSPAFSPFESGNASSVAHHHFRSIKPGIK